MDDELVMRSDNPLGNSAFLDESPFASYVSPFTLTALITFSPLTSALFQQL